MPINVFVSLYAFVFTLFPDMVIVPIDEIADAVIDPALSTTNPPLATDMVPVVLKLMLEARSLPVIEPSVMEELLTEFAPTDAFMPVNCEPLPINPVAVTVPITCRVVDGVVVPMPTVALPKFP